MINKKTRVKDFANELGRLAQGVGDRVNLTNTIFFFAHDKLPTDRRKDITYGQFVCNHRPQKNEPHQTRLVVGGNFVIFPGNFSTISADTNIEKLLSNINISTKGALFLFCGSNQVP